MTAIDPVPPDLVPSDHPMKVGLILTKLARIGDEISEACENLNSSMATLALDVKEHPNNLFNTDLAAKLDMLAKEARALEERLGHYVYYYSVTCTD